MAFFGNFSWNSKASCSESQSSKTIQSANYDSLSVISVGSYNIPGIAFIYCSVEQYEEVKSNLEKRFDNSRTIPGTRKYHSFVPQSKDTMKVKDYSFSMTSKIEKVTKQDRELE